MWRPSATDPWPDSRHVVVRDTSSHHRTFATSTKLSYSEQPINELSVNISHRLRSTASSEGVLHDNGLVAEFTSEDLRGSRFEDVDLSAARFHIVDLSGADFEAIDLTGAVLRDVDLVDVEMVGKVDNLSINGVDVGPLIEAELNRRDPERATLHPTTARAFREAWTFAHAAWDPVIERARRIRPDLLHERVNGEWSFIETQRHLLFVTDAWVKRTMLGDSSPYDALDLPTTELGDIPGFTHDTGARPTLDEVLALREERVAVVQNVLADLTDDVLPSKTDPNPVPGYPSSGTYSARRCLQTVVIEEWEHRRYAERDLAVLEEA